MKRSSGVRVAATVAVSALSLALVTGCGGGSDDSKESKESDGQATTAAKALSAAELKKAVIAEGDVEGYKVAATDAAQFPQAKSEIKVDKAGCEPIAWSMGGLAPGDTEVRTSSTATEEKAPTDAASKSMEDMTEGEMENAFSDAFSIDMTVVGLSSYEGDGAEKAFKSVSDAVESCSDGFTITAQGGEQQLTKIGTEKASGTGDESVAFFTEAVMEDNDGKPGTVHTEVVRHGSTIVTYYTLSLGALTSGEKYTVPAAVIDAQAAKLK
jgi:hypothetical protein